MKLFYIFWVLLYNPNPRHNGATVRSVISHCGSLILSASRIGTESFRKLCIELRKNSSYSFFLQRLCWWRVVNVTPWPLCSPRNGPPDTQDRSLGEHQSWTEHKGYRRNPFSLPSIEPWSRGHPVYRQIICWLITSLNSCEELVMRKVK
jgi:hypothetical protein